jgi:hypothetical protein
MLLKVTKESIAEHIFAENLCENLWRLMPYYQGGFNFKSLREAVFF